MTWVNLVIGLVLGAPMLALVFVGAREFLAKEQDATAYKLNPEDRLRFARFRLRGHCPRDCNLLIIGYKLNEMAKEEGVKGDQYRLHESGAVLVQSGLFLVEGGGSPCDQIFIIKRGTIDWKAVRRAMKKVKKLD